MKQSDDASAERVRFKVTVSLLTDGVRAVPRPQRAANATRMESVQTLSPYSRAASEGPLALRLIGDRHFESHPRRNRFQLNPCDKLTRAAKLAAAF